MRPLPDYVDGYGSVCESTGVLRPPAFVTRAATRIAPLARGRDKLLERGSRLPRATMSTAAWQARNSGIPTTR